MHVRRAVFLLTATLFLAVGLLRQPSYAQPGGANTCSSLVQTAIEALGNNCTGLGRNSACYGTFRVNATFSDPAAQAAFSAPADQASITTLQTIRTFPLNTAANEWGISVINAQANIPGALPGQNAVFLLIGDVEMENAVPAEESFQPGEPIPLQPLIASNLYAAPGIDAEVVAQIPADAEILTDAISEDGAWLRSAYDDQAGWVSRAAFAPETDLSSLPVYTPQSFTPMQAFYFRTRIGTECSEAPDAVVIQGPENLTIDINANGADIRLGSTILMQTVLLTPEEEQQLREQYGLTGGIGSLFKLVVLDGEAIINPNSDNPIHVPAGYSTVACLSEPPETNDGISTESVVLADCGFTPPTPVSETEWNNYAVLNNLTLNYPIDISDYLGDTCQPRSDWSYTYVVRPGDSLSAIAGFYNVSTQEMAQANCIEDVNTIYAGASLRVPLNVQPPTRTPTPTPTEIPPTAVPPTAVPPTSVPPTGEPPTTAPTATHTPTFTATFTPTLGPPADLAVYASALNAEAPELPICPGDIVTYSVSILNQGPTDATNIQISNVFPDGYAYVNHSEADNPNAPIGTYDPVADIWTIPALPQLGGENFGTLDVNVIVPQSAFGEVINDVYISASDQPDPVGGDNIARSTIVVEGCPAETATF
jgi:uncharacterized repeat protein (TIGR01451 family)